MTNPSEHREALARIIDPSSWRVMDGYLADTKRKYRGKDAGYDPEAFKDKASIAKADAILAYLAAQQEREDDAYAFVKTVGRLKHSDDEDAPPISFDDDHDTLNGLIAAARDIIATRKPLPLKGEG